MICIFPADEKIFSGNGEKILHPLKAILHKEDNGSYYLELKDNIENLKYYQEGLIIRVDTPFGKQCFRITNPKIDTKKVTVTAKHLYFDSSRYVISDSYVVEKNCNDAMDHLNMACDTPSPFTTLSDVTSINSYRCVRSSLEEAIATVIERWGGHLVRDNFNIQIRDSIGSDNGVTLEYGKNIKSINSDEVWDNVVTKLFPVGKDGYILEENFLEIEEKMYEIPYTKVVSFDQSHIEESAYTEDDYFDEDAYNSALDEDLRLQAL